MFLLFIENKVKEVCKTHLCKLVLRKDNFCKKPCCRQAVSDELAELHDDVTDSALNMCAWKFLKLSSKSSSDLKVSSTDSMNAKYEGPPKAVCIYEWESSQASYIECKTQCNLMLSC